MQPLSLLVASLMSETFRDLDVGISVLADGAWRAIHSVSRLLELGVELGAGRARYLYNVECVPRAERTRKIVRGQLFGFCDLFVPVPGAVLAVGPFLAERPTSARLLDSFHQMSQSHGRMSDPTFARFVSIATETLTLEGSLPEALERMLRTFARLIAGQDKVDVLVQEIEAQQVKLLEARFAEMMWEAARAMVDERTAHIWQTPQVRDPLARVGMKRAPQHVLVGLVAEHSGDADPLAMVLRRAALQRASAGLARSLGNAVSGRIGNHGITLLVDRPGGEARSRSALLDVAVRAQTVAKRFGLKLSFGIAQAKPGDPLTATYRSALGAAERAVSTGRSCVHADTHVKPPRLLDLRLELGARALEEPASLVPRFDRYIEAVMVHAGYQPGTVRAHLEAGLERVAEPLLDSGKLDRRSFGELTQAPEDESVTAMAASYRRAVAGLAAAVQNPTEARQDRSVRRGLLYVREHLPEPLGLARVARVAGFAPGHFARLVKRDEGIGFERYVQKLRLEHATTMLIETALDVGRVAHLSGFKSRTHFQRAFREATGVTPMAYRGRAADRATARASQRRAFRTGRR